MESPAFVFNGCYTIISPRDGAHRTFRIKTQKATANFAPNERIVSLLTGTDNENDYTSFGFLKDNGILVWRSKKQESATWEQYARMLWSLLVRGPESALSKMGYQIKAEKTCLICNRKLTEPKSLDSGIGPECMKRRRGRPAPLPA